MRRHDALRQAREGGNRGEKEGNGKDDSSHATNIDDQSDARKRKIRTPRPTTMRMRASRRLMRPPTASGFSAGVVVVGCGATATGAGTGAGVGAAVVVVTGAGAGAGAETIGAGIGSGTGAGAFWTGAGFC